MHPPARRRWRVGAAPRCSGTLAIRGPRSSAMTDPVSGAAGRQPVLGWDDERGRHRRPTSVPTCGARSSPIDSGSSTTSTPSTASGRRSAHSRRWSVISRAASTTTGTTTRRAPSSPSGRPPVIRSRQSSRRFDNGWLAAALHVVANSVPEVAARAGALFDSMHFGFYDRPDVNQIAGSVTPDTGAEWCCYDTIVSEKPDRQLHRDRNRGDPGQGIRSAPGGRSRTRGAGRR